MFFVAIAVSHVLRSVYFYVGFCLIAVPLPHYLARRVFREEKLVETVSSSNSSPRSGGLI